MKLPAYFLAPAFLLGATPALAQTPVKPAAPARAAAPAPVTPAAPPPAAPPPAAPAPEPAVAATPATEPAAPTPAATEPPLGAPEPVAAAVTTPEPAPAAPPAQRSSLEVFGYLAPTVTQGEPANPALTNSFRRVGVYGEAGFAFRSKYFLDPFISVGYGTLASGETELPDSKYGPGGTLHQHLGMWVISPGITTDIWRFRLRLGIGLAVVVESNRYQGDNNSATQMPLASQAGIGFNCYEVPKFRLDAEARYVTAKGADVTFWAIGVTARGDLLTY